ncbi:adenylosuccinate synthetase [Naegleria gruberi]|uniref:Adenylosuccinate synthetase n=1 Tax=Naegleria gruberi TaxID=5762 RepID=D2UXM2_NAEGR|nr:adenylosuccinate synthetase [Naegleria gruberi]EFC50658.1 adenylosuccinate synthetase [Naegleria gruberi]|eukprot:XP_002683402.1 adenylosuccinate synthetase [Naegleria gruberi strain NEG-M]
MSSLSSSTSNYTQPKASVCAVIGGQWGDEGKGKLVDLIAKQHQIICRYNGGANAGHTIVDELGRKYATNLLPSGVLTPGCINLIGNGVVLEIPKLFSEIDNLLEKKKNDDDNVIHDLEKRILISDRTHLVFGFHKAIDGFQEGVLKESGSQIGTTKRGIGPTYTTKAARSGLRTGDLLSDFETFEKKYNKLLKTLKSQYPTCEELNSYDAQGELDSYKNIFIPRIKSMIIDTVTYLHKAIYVEGRDVLLEGANAVMLDLDFGTYPFVTSSNPCIGGACTGLGIPPRAISEVYGVIKAYCTRVGSGPFPTELKDETGDLIRKIGGEFGTTTGRPRSCGWLDVVAVKYGCMINGFNALCLTKLDVLDQLDEVKLGVGYRLNGVELDTVPYSADDLDKVEVIYETYPGWKTDISKVRKFEDLPQNAQTFVKRIQEKVGVPVKWIGVGAGREAVVVIQ